MGDDSDLLIFTDHDGLLPDKEYKVTQVFLKNCSGPIYLRQRLCELAPLSDAPPHNKLTVKAAISGTVKEIYIKKNDVVTLGTEMMRLSVCRHPTMLGNTCGDCGVTIEEDDSQDNQTAQNTVSMLHTMPGLRVSMAEAERLGAEDRDHLLGSQKLVLLVDLDQTLIHTTNDHVPPHVKDVFHFRLHPHGAVYHARLRPYTRQFLANISELYELHICTFGVREYAHAIANILDPHKKLFDQRILSRNECLDPMSKKANLKSLFPCGDELVCIMDDRSDVWHFAPNVVQVLPYHFFEHTGDINAPPGLQKKENDSPAKGCAFSALKKPKEKKQESEEEQPLPPATTKQQQQDSNSYSDSDSNSNSLPSEDGISVTATVAATSADNAKKTADSITDSSADNVNTADAIADSSADNVNTADTIADSSADNANTADTVADSSADNDNTADNANTADSSADNDNTADSSADHAKKTADTSADIITDTTAITRTNADNNDKAVTTTDCEVVRITDTTQDAHSDSASPLSPPDSSYTSSNDTRNEIVSLNSENTLKSDKVSNDVQIINDVSNNSNETNNPELEDRLQSKKSNNDLSENTDESPDILDVPDYDDYLLHLEDILRKLHKEFYVKYKPLKPINRKPNESTLNDEVNHKTTETLSQAEDDTASFLPDLKVIVPEIRSRVLEGCNIVFSSVVPQATELVNSKAYNIAVSLGAQVTEDIVLSDDGGPHDQRFTTHLVAANLHTLKVHVAVKEKLVKVVTPDWLWCCMERWERVEEQLFPLTDETEDTLQRNPPHHCCIPPQFLSPKREMFIMRDKAKLSMMEEVAELLDSDDSGSDESSSIEEVAKKRQLHDSSSDSDEETRKRRHKKPHRRQQSHVRLTDAAASLPELSDSSEVEELDSGEEERLLKMEEELGD